MLSHSRIAPTPRSSHAKPTRAAFLARVAGLALVPSALALVPEAQAQDWRWNSPGSGMWNTAANWQSGTVPGLDARVFLGDTAAAQNSVVFLNVHPTIDDLSITDGMGLVTNGWRLNVTGNTVISGANFPGGQLVRSRLLVDGVDGTSFETNILRIEDGGLFQLRSAVARVNDFLRNDAAGRIEGLGQVRFAGTGTTFSNSGTIAPEPGLGLRLRQLGTGRFDLDGITGNGHLDLTRFDPITNTGARLELDGDSLSDSFGGTILMGEDSQLDMNLVEAWEADQTSIISMLGTGGPTAVATISSSSGFTFEGDAYVNNSGNLQFVSQDLVLTSTADVYVYDNGQFWTGATNSASHTRLDGVTFHVGDSGHILLEGDTTVLGATMTNIGGTGGTMFFADDSAWNGDLTADGRVVLDDGHAQVVGASTINTGVLVMGDSASTWTVGAPLTINADTLTGYVVDGLEGQMTITGGFTNSLTMNLTDPNASWRVGGRLTLAGVNAAIPITRVSGNRMRVEGNLDVTQGIARVNADADFVSGSEIFIADAATLRMQGVTVVEANAAFSGRGWLQNAPGATLNMEGGSSLELVGLRNAGDFFISDNTAGVASADRFESTPGARLFVDILGLAPGSGHDLFLITNGAAQLAGELVVLLDQTPGAFRPRVGDEFTILMAAGGVSGTFANVPGSTADGLEYGWQVVYNPNSAVLRLDRIVPSPGAAAILGLASLLAWRRRR